mgnify:CR=1 FL=1
MERKNYLYEDLSKEEKLYLKRIVLSAKNTYLRANYKAFNSEVKLEENIIDYSENLLEVIFQSFENSIKDVFEFEKVFSNIIIYKTIKALSLKEKEVLFLLFKEDMTVTEISEKMKIRRETVWRIKQRAQNKILKNFIKGE